MMCDLLDRSCRVCDGIILLFAIIHSYFYYPEAAQQVDTSGG